MALWEVAAPRRKQAVSRAARWPGNLGIAVLNTGLTRILLPTATLGMAVLAAEQGWGLLQLFVLPVWLSVVISVVLLDLAIYSQHVVFHVLPPLWRVHRMHHADPGFDVTTGVRFHPIEILLSMLIKLGVIAALGSPVIAVLAFEVLLSATSIFNHGNVRIASGLERVLRWIIVTPDMHRVHHSTQMPETNSNFGFNLSCWDRLFGTYRARPASGHEAMRIGLSQFRTRRDLRLDRLLLQPFVPEQHGRHMSH